MSFHRNNDRISQGKVRTKYGYVSRNNNGGIERYVCLVVLLNWSCESMWYYQYDLLDFWGNGLFLSLSKKISRPNFHRSWLIGPRTIWVRLTSSPGKMQVRQGFLEKALIDIERSAQCSRKPLYSPSVRLSRRRYSKLKTKGEATVLLLSAKKKSWKYQILQPGEL